MKVLIVEDNDRLCKSILDYARDEGSAADEAANGEEGYDKATDWHYDAMILSMMLPKVDAWQARRISMVLLAS